MAFHDQPIVSIYNIPITNMKRFFFFFALISKDIHKQIEKIQAYTVVKWGKACTSVHFFLLQCDSLM